MYQPAHTLSFFASRYAGRGALSSSIPFSLLWISNSYMIIEVLLAKLIWVCGNGVECRCEWGERWSKWNGHKDRFRIQLHGKLLEESHCVGTSRRLIASPICRTTYEYPKTEPFSWSDRTLAWQTHITTIECLQLVWCTKTCNIDNAHVWLCFLGWTSCYNTYWQHHLHATSFFNTSGRGL